MSSERAVWLGFRLAHRPKPCSFEKPEQVQPLRVRLSRELHLEADALASWAPETSLQEVAVRGRLTGGCCRWRRAAGVLACESVARALAL